MVHPHEYNSLHLNVSQHQLARLLVQEYCHVGLLVGVGGDNQALNLGGRSGGPKGRQLGFDGPCDSAIPWAALLELLSFLPGVCITSSCMCAWLSWMATAKLENTFVDDAPVMLLCLGVPICCLSSPSLLHMPF